MVEAQAFFDRYAAPACPEELMAPALHHVPRIRAAQTSYLGRKGVGSQGDGTAQFIARAQLTSRRSLRFSAATWTCTP